MMDTGIQLTLLMGATRRPAPAELLDALTSLEVRNNDTGRDGFQLAFSAGRDSVRDYRLLLNADLEPPSRVIIVVTINTLRHVLIDGLITNHQFSPGSKPGDGTLSVTGEDLSLQLDFEDRNEVYRNQGDSQMVTTILNRYASYGIRGDVTRTTRNPQENQITHSQQSSDLAYIQALASRNGFVFYLEPDRAPGRTKAHWGPQDFSAPTQAALTLNMGAATNVESLSFTFDALGPTRPAVSVLDPDARTTIPVQPPASTRPRLARRPAMPLRVTQARTTANQDTARAAETATATMAAGVDAVTGSGTLDAVRYGAVLRARRLVDVRGAGNTYDGTYYVKQVTHRIKRGEYKQSFSLSREGRVALVPIVRVR